jgi:penicillin-binding protein 1A
MAALPPDSPQKSPPSPRAHWPWRRIAFAGLLAFAAALAIFTGWALHVVRSTPGIEDMKQVQASRPSVLLSADGKTLAVFRRQQREPLKLNEVSPHVVQALIATEDRRFYDHKGDWT